MENFVGLNFVGIGVKRESRVGALIWLAFLFPRFVGGQTLLKLRQTGESDC